MVAATNHPAQRLANLRGGLAEQRSHRLRTGLAEFAVGEDLRLLGAGRCSRPTEFDPLVELSAEAGQDMSYEWLPRRV